MTLVSRFVPGAEGAPALLALHGRGGTELDLAGLGAALGTGHAVLAPRGPEREGPGFAWFRHEAIGVPVIESLDECLAQVATWLAEAVAEHGIATPMTAVGFSNGGMMAGSLSSVHPDLVGDVALLSSVYPLPPGILARGGLAGRRVLAVGGEDDPFLPPATVAAGVAAYRGAGPRSRLSAAREGTAWATRRSPRCGDGSGARPSRTGPRRRPRCAGWTGG